MAAISRPKIPVDAFSHVHPGLQIPLDIEERANREIDEYNQLLKRHDKQWHLKQENQHNLKYNAQLGRWYEMDSKEWNAAFRNRHLVIHDATPSKYKLTDPLAYQRACITANKFIGCLKKLQTKALKELLHRLANQINKLDDRELVSYRFIRHITFRSPELKEIWPNPQKLQQYYQINHPESLEWLNDWLETRSIYFLQEMDNSRLLNPIESSLLTEQDKDELKKIIRPHTSVEYIDSKMDEFLNMLHQRLNDPTFDAIEIAAWAHIQIVKIHPYSSGNGRLARLLMNMILRENQYPYIYFTSAHEYIKNVEASDSEEEIFISYIRKKVSAFSIIQKSQQVFEESKRVLAE